jgi:hypothetical protein
MKKMVYILLVLQTVLTIGVTAQTSSAFAKTTASVTLLEVLQLTKVEDMSFGRLVNGSVGSVNLSTTGERSVIGVTAIGESGWKPARFEVSGTPNFEYYIGLPNEVTLEKDGNQLVVQNLVAKPSSATENGLKGIITSNAFFTVGGKLVISSPNFPPGSYHTSFEVSVGYN